MSYDFYVKQTGNDNNSGSSNDDAPLWTGTLTGTGNTTLTRATGDSLTEALIGQFVRLDPGGPNDCNLRITAVAADGLSLTVAENAPAVVGMTANIGGALALVETAVGDWMDYPSVIPYGRPNTSVDADVNIWIDGSVDWTLDGNTSPSLGYLVIESADQNNYKLRRRIIGYKTVNGERRSGYIDGVFYGAKITFTNQPEVDAIIVRSPMISFKGLELVPEGYGISIYSEYCCVHQCYIHGSAPDAIAGAGVCVDLSGSMADIQACRFQYCMFGAYVIESLVSRCLFSDCITLVGGQSSVYINCLFDMTFDPDFSFGSYLAFDDQNIASLDFINCLVTNFSAANAAIFVGDAFLPLTFDLCVFQADGTMYLAGEPGHGDANVQIKHSVGTHAFDLAGNTYAPFPDANTVITGVDASDIHALTPEAHNIQFDDWPDPDLAKYCYESAGVRGLPVPLSLTRRRFVGRGPTKRDLMKP